MSNADLQTLEKTIDTAFDNRETINPGTRGEIRDAVDHGYALRRAQSGQGAAEHGKPADHAVG